MEDGTDRARRDPVAGSGRRRAAEASTSESADDVLARHGLLGGSPPAGDGNSHGRQDPPPSGTGGRRRRAEPDGPTRAAAATAQQRGAARPSGRRRAPEPSTGDGRGRHSSGGASSADPGPRHDRGTDQDAGNRHAGSDHDRTSARNGTRVDEAAPRDGGTPRAEPHSDPDPGNDDRGGRRRAADRPGRHAPPEPHVDDPGSARGAGGTGNFLDGTTARGRAALESSGALQRTRAVTPGWVRAGDQPENGAEATTRLTARTDRDTAPNAKVPGPPDGPRRNDRRGGGVDDATAAVPHHGNDGADRPASRAHDEADDQGSGAERVARIDETLTRMTAAHAGLVLASDADDDEPPAPARPRFTALRLVCLLLAVVVLGTAACGYAARAWLESAVPDVAATDARSSAIVDAAAQSGATNVLMVAGERETIPGTAARGAATFAIAHVPAGGGPVTVLALPADLEINRPPCESFDPISRSYTSQPVPAEARTKLVSALTVGGPRCVTRVVQQLTGLAVTSYVGIDLDELARLVDAVGGVDVCVARPVVDAVLGPILPTAGAQQLGGDRTLDYLRAGDVAGDPATGAGQVERQQGVLAAALAPLLSSTGLLDVGRLATARPVLGRALLVDGLHLDQVQATAETLHQLDAEGVRFVAVPTMSGPVAGAVVLRDAEAAALFAAVRTDQPLPATTALGAGGPQPGDAPVEVLNASDRPGLATKIGDTLRQLGFGVGQTGNAPQRTSETLIRYSPDREAAAKLLAASVPSATSVPDPGSSGVLQLVLGRSFDDVVRPPAGTAPAADAAQAAPAGGAQCA